MSVAVNMEEKQNDMGKNYVAISPDGSIVAKFNPNYINKEDNKPYSCLLIKKVDTDDKDIPLKIEKDKFGENVHEWSLAVSDANENICFVAISCIIGKDVSHQPQPNNFERSKIFNNEVFEQLQLAMNSKSKGEITIFRCDLTHYKAKTLQFITYSFDGVNKNNKGQIELDEKDCFLLPENLFKELENNKDAWKYLLKSRYQEYLMTDRSYNQQLQHIEIYNVNTSQLVNIFYRNRGKKNNEPGIFAISTDSDLFAYSSGDNTITIYLMESGLEVVSKKIDCVSKIKFLEFIDGNNELFIISEDNKFHTWLLSGCLDDLFSIEHNTSTLLSYNHTLTKASGMVVFLDENKNIKILHDLINKDTKKPVKSDSEKFSDENFNKFKKLYHEIKVNKLPKWDDNITTIIKTACGLLVYMYNTRNDEENSIYINAIEKFIRTFIENCPDHWKLMEIQYPLMAFLICARSFSLIKFILFEKDSKEKNSKEKDSKEKVSKVKNLHRPRSQYSSYPNYHEEWKLSKSDNDLKLALSFCKDRDAVMLAYLLEYYSENSLSHIGWMINVTKILPELSKHKYANYVDLLYFKSCFGEMKYNFSNKRFKTVSFKQDLLEVYLPLTQLIPTNFVSLVTYSNYRKLRCDMSSDICMVPLPNFTTCPNEELDEEPEETEKFEKFWTFLKICAKLFRKIFIPIDPLRLNLKDDQFSPFLQIEKYDSPFFYIPAMEAVINSRWKQAKTNWMIFLIKYLIFLILFSYLSQIFLKNNENYSKTANIVMIVIFYYLGIDLFIVQFLRMKNILSILHTFDLCSTILGIINLTLIISGIESEWIILLTSVTTLILWFEMLLWLRLYSGIAISIYIFGNILKIIIPFFAFMIVLTVGFGHSMFILFGYPSLVNLHPSISTYTLNNGSENFTLTGTEPDNPFDTLFDAILSAYYWNTLSFSDYNYWPLKLLTFLANVILVLVLLNMIIALMNDAFNKAKEDGKHGLLIFRSELINDYERLYGADLYKSLQSSKYICFRRDQNLMKEWLEKSKEIREEKLYSWFDEDTSNE
ncbi:hypothetical protein C1646_813030 [Rhizophagus diaphanus]|nr:hypothetical protein C1646_813030 [Rhizophagus diaphanus] [Rhizophagus sp. MUCL 43196]